jgi:hypothetical protein
MSSISEFLIIIFSITAIIVVNNYVTYYEWILAR